MQMRPRLRSFGWRLVICLLILGLAYIVIILRPWHDKPLTPTQKIANIRSLLSQGYVAGSDINGFTDASPAAAYDLASLEGQITHSVNLLHQALQTAPSQLNDDIKPRLETVLARQHKAHKSYTQAYEVLAKAIQYDPERDLGSLDPNIQADEFKKRSTAAQNGLKTAADNKTTVSTQGNLSVESNSLGTLVLPKTKELLLRQAYCFQRLAEARPTDASVLRQQCLDSYAETRHQAIRNIIESSYNAEYQAFMKAKIPPLLVKLDKLSKE